MIERSKMTFVICLNNEGYEASLELRKIYQVIQPEPNDPRGYIRIIDESGEDYLYDAKAFEPVHLPPRTERKVKATLA
jgi:hypothetical protein